MAPGKLLGQPDDRTGALVRAEAMANHNQTIASPREQGCRNHDLVGSGEAKRLGMATVRSALQVRNGNEVGRYTAHSVGILLTVRHICYYYPRSGA